MFVVIAASTSLATKFLPDSSGDKRSLTLYAVRNMLVRRTKYSFWISPGHREGLLDRCVSKSKSRPADGLCDRWETDEKRQFTVGS